MATTPTTSTTEPIKVKLKLMIDKRANKVIFAEAGKDFVDILFNLLFLPFAIVARLLRNAGMVSCTDNLYQSLENLNEAYLLDSQNKVELVKPLLKWGNAFVLLQPPACPQPLGKNLYPCQQNHGCVANQFNSRCSHFSYSMTHEVQQLKTVSDKDVGIVNKLFTYMVTDDLSVTPGLSTISGVALLESKVENIDAMEDRVVEIGIDEVLELLKASLQTNSALTTVFLKVEATAT